MKVGDKVRMLSGTEEGVVTRILQNNQVEVEISDGFRLPVMRGEIVVVSQEEDKYFGKQTSLLAEEKTSIEAPPSFSKKKSVVGEGIYLAYTNFNDQLLNVYLINHTDYAMLINVNEQLKNGKEKHLFAEVVSKNKAPKIHRLSREEFNNWNPLVVRAIFFKRSEFEPKPNLFYQQNYSSSFFRTKRTAPIIEREAYLFRVEGREVQPTISAAKMQSVNVNELRERMIEGIAKNENYRAAPPKSEIDLHIEELAPEHYDVMTNEAILNMQLDHFEKVLDQALAANMETITFIHGVGNGVLRREIQKRLSQHPFVKFYQDAQKGKFGYGATIANFK